jgi:opacity protein-like surface antigen
MGSLKSLALAGAAVLASIPAVQAADLPPIIQRAPPVVADDCCTGWYLRGDVGFTAQQVGSLFNDQVNNGVAGITVNTVDKAFDGGTSFGLGVGYQFNSFLRADVTGEYRFSANFHGLDITTFPNGFGGTAIGNDSYSASMSSWLFLANLYADLGTWWCVTPFVGGGVGVAYNTISNFRDLAVGSNNTQFPITSTGFANSASTTSLAWALYGGLSYKVTPGFTVELAYRYLNLGKAQTGDLVAFDGTQNLGPMQFRDLTSQDVKLGLRWMIQPAQQPAYYPPVVTKG